MRDNSYINLALPVYMVVMTEAAGCFLYNRGRIYRFYYFLFPLTIVAVQILIGCLVLGYMSARWGTFVFVYYLSNVALIVRQLAEILATGVWAVLLCRRKYEEVRGVWFAGLFLPPIVSAFIIFSLIFIGNVFMQMYGVFLIIVDIFLLVSMNFYIWYLFSYQAKNKKLEAELEIWRKQSEMQYRYYERVEAQYLSSRKMIHDMRNHLQAIEALNDQDAAKGKAYMRDMHQMLDSFGLVSYTDERMLNRFALGMSGIWILRPYSATCWTMRLRRQAGQRENGGFRSGQMGTMSLQWSGFGIQGVKTGRKERTMKRGTWGLDWTMYAIRWRNTEAG